MSEELSSARDGHTGEPDEVASEREVNEVSGEMSDSDEPAILKHDRHFISIVHIQSLARRFIARCRVLVKLRDRFEKIFDFRRKRYYYYDKVTDMSSWRKHLLFFRHDVLVVSSMFTRDSAAEMIQKYIRRYLSRLRVRLLYQSIVSAVADERTGGTYYYNNSTGQTMWELPKFMRGKLTHKRRADRRPGDSTDEDSGRDGAGSDGSDSEAEKLRRKMARKYPRSKIQDLVDVVEDDWTSSERFLDLSGFQSTYITSRIFDLTNLHTLNLENNRITKLSDQIAYLSKLQVLNLRHNRLTAIPKEIEDCKFLRVVYLGNNLLKTLPGEFFLLGRLNELELSGNPMENLPIITGDMKLLKILKDWEVGVSAFKQLKELCASAALLKQWPPQIDRISKLERLDLSYNALVRAPESIARNGSLTHLDLSHNKLVSVPVEIYGLPLQILKLNNNKLTEMPDPSDIRPGTYIRGEQLVELDITENDIGEITAWVKLYSSMSRLYASLNRVNILSHFIGDNIFIRELDMNGCLLLAIPPQLGHCTLLVKLYLECNQLSHLPLELSSLMQLEELRLSHNLLTNVAVEIFQRMTHLKVITLEDNLLTQLPASIYTLPALIFLDVSDNRLESIGDEISQLVSLKTLLLGDNLISQIPSTISDCSHLTIFEIHNNRLQSLPPSLGKLRALRRFTIYNNCLGPKIPRVLAELSSLPFYNISGNGMSSLLSLSNPISSFTEECRDIRMIKVYLNVLWGIFHGENEASEASNNLNAPDITIGAVCSTCHTVTAAYFTSLPKSPAIFHVSEEGGEPLGDYWPIMDGFVKNMLGAQRDTTLSSFVNPDENNSGQTETLHSMHMTFLAMPPGNTQLEFLQNVQSLEQFSTAARALFGVCTAYNEEYIAWKLKIREPEPIVSDTTKPTATKIVPKGKPKQVSFRKGLSTKSMKSTKASNDETDADAADNDPVLIDGHDEPTFLEDSATKRSGEGESATSDRVESVGVTSAEEDHSLSSHIEPILTKLNSPTTTRPESNIAAELERVVHSSVPPPPHATHLPLLSEVAIRSMLEHRHGRDEEDPHISRSRVFQGSQDPLVCLLYLADCYNGIGASLIRIADFLCSLLRIVEERGLVSPSCLTICQRLYDDFDDLMGEKAASFSRRKYKTPGSDKKTANPNDILAQVGSMPSTRKKNGASQPNSASASTAASIDEQDQMESNTEVEEHTDDFNDANLHSILDTEAAKRTVSDIDNYRRRVLLLGAVFLDRALLILKACGWDAKSMKMQKSALSSRRAVHHFEAMTQINTVVHVGYYYGRAMQHLRVCSTAVREYYAVLSIGPLLVWHPLQLEIVKCYLEMGEFLKAEELLFTIVADSPSLRMRSDKSKDVGELNSSDSNLSREVRMLAAILSSALVSLRQTGVGAKEQISRYELEHNGVMHRRPVVAAEVEVGRTNRLLKKISDLKAADKAIFASEKREYDRNDLLEKVEEAKRKAFAVMQSHQDFIDDIGPIVMPE